MAGQEIYEYAKVLGIFFTYIFPLLLITMNLVNTVEVYSLHLHNKLTLKQSGELSLPQRGSEQSFPQFEVQHLCRFLLLL